MKLPVGDNVAASLDGFPLGRPKTFLSVSISLGIKNPDLILGTGKPVQHTNVM